MTVNKLISILAAAGCLAACSGTTSMTAPEGVAADYGNSARSLIQAQTANPATLTSPGDAVITGVDPDYANNVVNAMREDVPKPEDVRKPITIVLSGENTGF